ncbi:hypothetical protein ACO1Y9_13500 [Klebsiella quasipneumoniae]|uniref:Uncharacterized protein n=1 Tax=Kluyvera sichuanensis TaxID=2725494 RepID=A0ABR6S131_9ENTR|nr:MULTISPECIES: hypothetical protein [Enterobacteriaceae]EGQ5322070.1 hypothetical protein [Enterobacter asburiae]ELR9541665.1 hypothetical protein [Enterobacter asburiae]MBC1189116.1 hypothetical protein [Kluyvera sichuanensis]MEB2379219.1 hypothetical protein [Enterobacter sp. R-1.5.3]MEB2427776.1 hypothetical protein [Enterobacter sp. R-1.6.2]
MSKLSVFIFTLLFCSLPFRSYSDDFSNKAVKSYQAGDWVVVEFAADKQLVYKMATEAINKNLKETYLSFYFTPPQSCKPTTAEIVMFMGGYNDALDGGKVPMAFKIPGGKEDVEVVDTSMQKNDQFAFFKFQQLTVQKLMSSPGNGNLAVWIPSSGDKRVKGSSNMYFSLNGFKQAYAIANKLCTDNL